MEVVPYRPRFGAGGRPSTSFLPQFAKNDMQNYNQRQRNVWTSDESNTTTTEPPKSTNGKNKERLCKFWVVGNCMKGDRCRILHSWFQDDNAFIFATLQGQTKVVTGIAYPLGGDKLYSGNKDKTFRIWNHHTGQFEHVINLDTEVCSLIQEGPWIFVVLPNLVKAWNIQSDLEFNLDGPVGQLYSMMFNENMFFAGT